ncbi:zf-TFIIB domain-containing protein [Burkholderia stagnalis]|uniref:zf-TFIIB domain-containing protein n=1 Tax=Burkholderia stagnalis TaxID=1503054 RepID=UPI0009C0734D|nr:zf-TFIIB domain-containing protein [Burkholderia stagnalis]
MICPRCEQDEILEARIKANGRVIYICPECDATWLSSGEIRSGNFFDYGTYMKSMGLSQLWDELEVIKRI